MGKINFEHAGEQTKAIHGGENPEAGVRSSSPDIVMSTTFLVDADTGFSAETLDDSTNWVYTRWGNPTTHQLELKLAILEQGESAITFATGMSAISSLVFHTLKSGDHLLISDVTYAAFTELANSLIPELNIEVTKVDITDLESVSKAIRTNTKLVYIESPCNPLLRLTDIRAVADIAHKAGAKLAIDSTFATPIATKPLLLGADYVIHSLTKYLGGHGDALGGAIIGSYADIEPFRKKTAIRLGGSLSPFNAWLIMRGLATFPIRMKAHEENALKIAQYLEQHPKVKRVIYPGLASHPQHELAKRQMKNFSGMLTFQLENGQEVAGVLSRELKIVHYAVSLGHHRTLVFYLGSKDLLESTFHFETEKQLQSWEKYMGDGVFRLSTGLEDADDIIADLEQALAKID